MALAVDPARDEAMRNPPHDPGERILDTRRLFAIGRAGAVMAMGTVTLTVTQWALCLGTASTVLLAEFVLRALRSALRGKGVRVTAVP